VVILFKSLQILTTGFIFVALFIDKHVSIKVSNESEIIDISDDDELVLKWNNCDFELHFFEFYYSKHVWKGKKEVEPEYLVDEDEDKDCRDDDIGFWIDSMSEYFKYET
jgi:hypothetical protein